MFSTFQLRLTLAAQTLNNVANSFSKSIPASHRVSASVINLNHTRDGVVVFNRLKLTERHDHVKKSRDKISRLYAN